MGSPELGRLVLFSRKLGNLLLWLLAECRKIFQSAVDVEQRFSQLADMYLVSGPVNVVYGLAECYFPRKLGGNNT
jgi:hypothetical protein